MSLIWGITVGWFGLLLLFIVYAYIEIRKEEKKK